jgi:cation diffusion facilitator family transporter
MSAIDLSKYQHDHSFGQDAKRSGESRTLIVIVITAVMMVVEISTGIAFGSMALLADGMHMASHALALGINYFAYIYARRHAHDPRFSFGTGKVNALGGFSGAILLALFAIMMAWESVERLVNPTEIAFNSAILVAIIGLVVNGGSVFILGGDHHHDHGDGHDHSHGHGHSHDDHNHSAHEHHHHHDHNLRSAYLHVLADALTSVTAIIALLAAKYFGWIWMDPLMGIVGSLLVAKWSVGLLKQTSRTLLDHQAPEEVLHSVRHKIEDDGHSQLSDLHVWAIAPDRYAVVAAIVSEAPESVESYRERLQTSQLVHITVETHTQ